MSDNTSDKLTVKADETTEVEVEDLEASAAQGCASTIGTISCMAS